MSVLILFDDSDNDNDGRLCHWNAVVIFVSSIAQCCKGSFCIIDLKRQADDEGRHKLNK